VERKLLSRRSFAFSALVLVVVGFAGASASAVTSKITEPSSSPYAVPADAARTPQPFTIAATGFRPGSLVYVEQCDGVAPTSANWTPTLNCDIGSSPAAAVVDSRGVATFKADDRNHAFHPFVGASPQQVFNCVAPGAAAPKNTLKTFTNCRVRVSSSNAAETPDQAFLVMTLPAGQATSTSSSSSSSSNVGLIVALVVAAMIVIAGAWLFITRRRHAAPTRRG
jgi:hypothetical protein